ncbi:MAG: TlyA family RNA methyltransferase [Chloroflexi bacterium]|nr:MAG: TlyA family RNA methyltransferase [Chloroflexota bacterium]
MPKTRLDLLLVERGLAESRAKAQAIIMAGQVRVNGQVADKASAAFPPEAQVEVDSGPRFVSRGGEKLAAALEAFPVNPAGLTCADVGASTGGFSDCLLQLGAAKIYAIDVGKGILHWKLRSDPRIVVMEETNARHVESLPEPVQLVVCDASFISLKILLPVMKKWITPLLLPPFSAKMGGETEGGIITLIKPQFEAGRVEVARGRGVVRNPEIHRKVLLDILAFAQGQDLGLRGLIRSPLKGPQGNTEFLAWLDLSATSADIPALVEKALTL